MHIILRLKRICLRLSVGFTLDKESNTIAILCQDLTVVLAFDTRERLIQWQVKIAHNLGEGISKLFTYYIILFIYNLLLKYIIFYLFDLEDQLYDTTYLSFYSRKIFLGFSD